MRYMLISAIIVIALIAISGCARQKTIREANVCGDSVCGATEDCNSCAKDCACPSGKYCTTTGICKSDVCGDGICSKEENDTNSCCEDCGCSTDMVCNKVTETCQNVAAITDDSIRVAAASFMTVNNISGNITTIIDTYYKNQTVKQVYINCKAAEMPYPCAIYLYIDASGKVLDSIRTA